MVRQLIVISRYLSLVFVLVHCGEYGTFSVVVRKFDDTDSKIEVLEQFDNLTLDPDSVNYIGARIGTAHPVIDSNGSIYMDGEFPNNSNYVYVSMADGIETLPNVILPYGFDPLNAPLNRADVPAPSYIKTRYFTPTGTTTAIANNKTYYGFDAG
jgi:hypothetical protein